MVWVVAPKVWFGPFHKWRLPYEFAYRSISMYVATDIPNRHVAITLHLSTRKPTTDFCKIASFSTPSGGCLIGQHPWLRNQLSQVWDVNRPKIRMSSAKRKSSKLCPPIHQIDASLSKGMLAFLGSKFQGRHTACYWKFVTPTKVTNKFTILSIMHPLKFPMKMFRSSLLVRRALQSVWHQLFVLLAVFSATL